MKLNGLLYEFKPFFMFALGFLCGNLEHPIKWLSLVILVSIAIYFETKRYFYRKDWSYFKFEKIEIKGIKE